MKKFMWLILALVAFASGMIVAFEWMGHDDGLRVYSLLKRDVLEKEVVKEVYKPVAVTDDVVLELMLQEYRDALIRISDAQDDFVKCSDAEKEIKRLKMVASQAMVTVNGLAKGDQ